MIHVSKCRTWPQQDFKSIWQNVFFSFLKEVIESVILNKPQLIIFDFCDFRKSWLDCGGAFSPLRDSVCFSGCETKLLPSYFTLLKIGTLPCPVSPISVLLCFHSARCALLHRAGFDSTLHSPLSLWLIRCARRELNFPSVEVSLHNTAFDTQGLSSAIFVETAQEAAVRLKGFECNLCLDLWKLSKIYTEAEALKNEGQRLRLKSEVVPFKAGPLQLESEKHASLIWEFWYF